MLNALINNIDPDSIQGLVTFVHYKDDDGAEQRAVFSGGVGLDGVIDWAHDTLKEARNEG